MTPEPPVELVRPSKNRRASLIFFGILEILIGCVFLLVTLSTLLTLPSASRNAPQMPPSPISFATSMLIAAIFEALIANLFIVVGIGSILCKN